MEAQRTANKTCPVCRHTAVPSRLAQLLRRAVQTGCNSRRGEVAVVGVGANNASASATGGEPQLRFEHVKMEILPALLDIVVW